MGVFRWFGGQIMAPIRHRKHAYEDLRDGLGSGVRAARRGFRLSARREPPIFPGTADKDISLVYRRWEGLGSSQRKTAWREFDGIMRILMQREAKSAGGRWSLDIPLEERAEIYAKASKRARTALWIYTGLMSIPVVLFPWHGDNPIYWLNLIAAAIILSPNVLRHLVVRAQVFHGGKVKAWDVFRRYPAHLPEAVSSTPFNADAQTSSDMMRSGAFPMISWLYGIPSEGEQ